MNKLWIMIVVSGLVLSSCGNKTVSGEENVSSEMIDSENPPVITFEEDSHDFGTISQGEKVKHTFYFKNTGESPLIIHSAHGSCGCTIPDWPKDPIAPGKEGKIEVSYNSEYRKGPQEKTVTIVANTKPIKTVLKISCNVAVPEE